MSTFPRSVKDLEHPTDLAARAPVVIVNPLRAALGHYSRALAANVEATGRPTEVVSVAEPSASGRSRWSWVFEYARALMTVRRRARKTGARSVIITWPVLGHLDLLFCRIFLGRSITAHVVLHDPKPLVSARGYSSLSMRIGRLLRGRHGLILHGDEARAEVVRQGLRWQPPVLPHPVLPKRDLVNASSSGEITAPVVRVLGQYKPDRDVELLARLAHKLSGRVRLEIVGRGWPEVSGWDVREGFVDEATLDRLVATSSAVLIPYKRFFQSGIAVRSLESGVPFVGPRDSVLATMYDADSPLLVSDASTPAESVSRWTHAVLKAVALDASDLALLAESAEVRAANEWGSWLDEAAVAA